MLRTILAGALASGALLAGGGAHAQDYYDGGYGVGVGGGVGVGFGGRPAYAGGGYGYEPYRPRGFTLAGVRAGVTVLGVDVDGSAKLTIGAHDWGRGGYAPAPYSPPIPQPYYPPQPFQPASPPPGYWMGYSAPCGCAPPPPPQPCCGYGASY